MPCKVAENVGMPLAPVLPPYSGTKTFCLDPGYLSLLRYTFSRMAPTLLLPIHAGNHAVKTYLVAAALLLAALFIFVLVRFLGQLRVLWSTTQAERDDMGVALRRLAGLLAFIAGHTNAPGATIDPLSTSRREASSPSDIDIAFPSPVRYFVRFYDVRGGRGTGSSSV